MTGGVEGINVSIAVPNSELSLIVRAISEVSSVEQYKASSLGFALACNATIASTGR
jgi:hypothetical protein